jgi:hypothetical protein
MSLPVLAILLMVNLLSSEPQSASKNDFCIVFYNVENLFDVKNDPETKDDDFTPDGKNHWTYHRLDAKLQHIYKTLIASGKGEFPDIIGLAEIENRWVLKRLIDSTPLSRVPYGIIHKDSPDPRGIDVALLYRKDRIDPVDFDFLRVVKEGKKHFESRDILYFSGRLNGDTVHFFVNHWPSRYGGYMATKKKRNFAARILRQRIDTILKSEPDAHILLMGDFNATRNEGCLRDVLRAAEFTNINGSDSLINLTSSWRKEPTGTLRNQGRWAVFDQFICSPSLLDGSKLRLDLSRTHICHEAFLLEADEKYLGSKPNRTYIGPAYHGGFSDHLPIVTVLHYE